MTTSNNIASERVSAIEPVLLARQFKKVNNGLWESETGSLRVYAFGSNPLQEWKVFQREGARYNQVPGGTGNGPDDLLKFLQRNTV